MRAKAEQSGQTLVEFALVLPLLLMLIFGIIEFGRIFSVKLSLDHAAGVGAKEAAMGRAPGFIKEKTAMACGGVKLEENHITVTFTDEDGQVVEGIETADEKMIFGDQVSGVYAKVSIFYEFEPIVPFPEVTSMGDILTLKAESFVRVQ